MLVEGRSFKTLGNIYNLKSVFSGLTKRQFSLPTSTEVVIPNYIPRGPTDILRALASTVRSDPTAPHYVYHDDPYLIPQSNLNKRSYVLSKESGRRAARYFLEKFPENFENDDAEPRIPPFNPPLKVVESTSVSVDMLSDLIHTLQVENAYQAFCNLKNAGVNVNHELQCELLELLCFYNSTEPNDETHRDERWFNMNQNSRLPNTVWKKDGLVEKLFQEMEKDARVYQALVQGLCRYNNIEAALKIYSEMKELGFNCSTNMYNGLIRVSAFQTGNSTSKWTHMLDFLQAMAQEGLQPNLGTFNNTLYALTRLRGLKDIQSITRAVSAEMKAVGVEPSLATFSHLLNIYCYTSKDTTSFILHDIMDLIEHQPWDLRDPDDMTFFPMAMANCNRYLQDKDLAHRVHAMFCRNDNQKFIDDAQRFNMYYSSYFSILISLEEPEKFFEIYEAVVPLMYTPEPRIMEEIVESINVNGKLQYLPKLWSDVRVFQMNNRAVIIENIISAVAKGGEQSNVELEKQLVTMVWDVFECVVSRNSDEGTRFKITWTGAMISDLLTCFLNAKDYQKAWEVLAFLNNKDTQIIGDPSPETLLRYCKFELESGSQEKALVALRYVCNADIPEAADFLKANEDKIPKEFRNKYLTLDRPQE